MDADAIASASGTRFEVFIYLLLNVMIPFSVVFEITERRFNFSFNLNCGFHTIVFLLITRLGRGAECTIQRRRLMVPSALTGALREVS